MNALSSDPPAFPSITRSYSVTERSLHGPDIVDARTILSANQQTPINFFRYGDDDDDDDDDDDGDDYNDGDDRDL